MPQTLFLYPNALHDTWFASRQDEGVLRASAASVAGDFAAIGLLSYTGAVPQQKVMSATSSKLSSDSSTDDGPLHPPPIQIPILPIFGQPAHIPPDLHVVFLFLQVESGQVRVTADAIAADGDDRLAVAIALGSSDVSIVVEVVGSEHDEVLGRVLSVVDRAAVTSFRSLHTNGVLTRGFGTDGGTVAGIPAP